MPWIENTSMKNVIEGLHYFEESRTILIQIQDKNFDYCKALYHDKFAAVYRFQFDDSEEEEPNSITDNQASFIGQILLESFHRNQNIVVHCHAGLCRSGAVADVGEIIGFQYAGQVKIPNLRVKSKILSFFRKE